MRCPLGVLPGVAKEHEENLLRILDGHRFLLLGTLWLSVQVEFLDYQVFSLGQRPGVKRRTRSTLLLLVRRCIMSELLVMAVQGSNLSPAI